MFSHAAMYAPQGAFFSELFGTRVRYSGASLGSQLSSVVAGGLSPFIATALMATLRIHGARPLRDGDGPRHHRGARPGVGNARGRHRAAVTGLSMTTSIGHYIAGHLVAGTSGRCGVVYNPARGAAAKQVAFATAGEVDAAVTAAATAFPQWAAQPPLRRARVLMKFRELLERDIDRLARIVTAEHGKVLSDAMGEVQRGIEVVEFATGMPQLLKGEYSDSVGPRRRQLLDPSAARRRRGHHAVQLPRDGAALDVPDRARVRQHVRAEAVARRIRRLGVALAHLLTEAGLPPASSTSSTATRKPSTRCSMHPDDRGRQLRRLDADRRDTSTRGTARRQARAGARRREESPRRDAGRRSRPDGGRARWARPTGRPASAAWRFPWRSPSATHVADALVEQLAPQASGAEESAPGDADGRRHGSARHRARTATRCGGYVDAGVNEGAKLVVDGRG